MAADSLEPPVFIEGKTETADPSGEAYDIVVVGGGTGGCFAGAAAVEEGADVAILERKSPADVGAIACGDALHDPLEAPGPIDGSRIVEEAIERYGAKHDYIARGIWQDIERGHSFAVPFGDDKGNVIHRHAYGQVIADESIETGVDFYADTVVQEARRNDTWEVDATQDGEPVRFEADLLIDAGGALSSVQDGLDSDGYFDDTTFETPSYDQVSAAYREIVRTEEPVPYASEDEGALLIAPTEQLGYFWVFTFTPTIHNVGLGFQMSEEPMQMARVQRRELERRPEFENAEVIDKQGSAVTTRRPLDSAVAPAYMAVGGAAATTSPTTGKGIEPAMTSGVIAGRYAAEAVADGDTSEAALFPFWRDVMGEFGARYAAQDVWNVAGMAHDVDTLRGVVAAAPRENLLGALTAEGEGGSLTTKLSAAATYLGRTAKYWARRKDGTFNADQIDALLAGIELSKVADIAERTKRHYLNYPDDPGDYDRWLQQRYALDAELIERVGSDEKYPIPKRFRRE